MKKSVIVVSSTEGFIIKGLETKIQGIGVNCFYCSLDVDDLKTKSRDASLVIVYTDESISKRTDALVYLKDQCFDKDKQIVVVGTKEEYQVLQGFIQSKYVYKFLERPLNMDIMLNTVEEYLAMESEFSRRRSILIVDDDVSYMSMIMDWLKDSYRVSLANSGMEAITWLVKNNTVDLILLDYEMPVTTGPQVLEMLRSNPSTADIPVMFLTGRGDKESVVKVMSLKPVGYLLKSVDRNGLRENLANFFNTRKKL